MTTDHTSSHQPPASLDSSSGAARSDPPTRLQTPCDRQRELVQKVPRYHFPTFGCTLLLSLLFTASCILLVVTVRSSFYHQLDPKGCLMTYMYPAYYRILGFDREKTPLAGKYGLMLYRADLDDNPPSFPVADPSQLTQIGHHDWAIAKSAKVSELHVVSIGDAIPCPLFKHLQTRLIHVDHAERHSCVVHSRKCG